LDFDSVDGVFGQILSFRGYNGNQLTLKIYFLSKLGKRFTHRAHRIALRKIFEREHVRHSRHLLRFGGIETFDPCARMWTPENNCMQKIRKVNASRVLRLTCEPGDHDFGHRQIKLSDHVKIHRWVALPLFGGNLLVALNDGVTWKVPTTG